MPTVTTRTVLLLRANRRPPERREVPAAAGIGSDWSTLSRFLHRKDPPPFRRVRPVMGGERPPGWGELGRDAEGPGLEGFSSAPAFEGVTAQALRNRLSIRTLAISSPVARRPIRWNAVEPISCRQENAHRKGLSGRLSTMTHIHRLVPCRGSSDGRRFRGNCPRSFPESLLSLASYGESLRPYRFRADRSS